MPGFEEEGPPLDDWQSDRAATVFELRRTAEEVFLNFERFTTNVVEKLKERDSEQTEELSKIFNAINREIHALRMSDSVKSEEIVRLKAQLKRTQLAVGYLTHMMEKIMEKLDITQ